ncbi:MAG: hypothetical protein Q8N88_05315 [Nanoarchaeota archaeon]|nr:hypothetical protein [Nanoarchaeota archaeon]
MAPKQKTNARKFGASRASQEMCLEPRVTMATEVGMILADEAKREVEAIITEASRNGGFSNGHELAMAFYIGPNWRSYDRIPEKLLD